MSMLAGAIPEPAGMAGVREMRRRRQLAA